ncbi:diguanylate cyclase [Enterobacter asburiae]|uniref:Diguanylate cyclase n=1 Tax=Enterobacter asburiae TaxID=61645 RepID=A0A376F2I5_ENTAS|nr:diguanylate cyclase [Enterobacter asburiae]
MRLAIWPRPSASSAKTAWRDQRLEKERDADWAIRELLARMTQRLQGCENFNDVINVAELFAPNIAPGDRGPTLRP